ncbi:uncharacterized protein LOC124366103 isoform X2 [Homalodisca vitripennis]|uniref:uncharacterized protein LOC124366103 isoform X2 n=1 Tax=Homalodisca vitripennis TaxID=197043 RepID=UPI001EEBA5DB|nr:uncharacterized protein LOC124366103 isoform X2 [Homalodisca vitripennis]
MTFTQIQISKTHLLKCSLHKRLATSGSREFPIKTVEMCNKPTGCSQQGKDHIASYMSSRLYTRDRLAQTSAKVAAFNARTTEPPTQVRFDPRGYLILQEDSQRVSVPKTELTLFENEQIDIRCPASAKNQCVRVKTTRSSLPPIHHQLSKTNHNCTHGGFWKTRSLHTNLPKL